MKTAAVRWARETRRSRSEVIDVAIFGSYARGDSGFGSDLDLLVIVKESALPFERRTLGYDTSDLPVQADLLVYTASEWESMIASGSRFARMISSEAEWFS